ncbi:MAG: hypothetical protein PW734_06850 [Verrucomicrobium sp.]|nr:hypothetical protein [Verrucomicrobium sp.]
MTPNEQNEMNGIRWKWAEQISCFGNSKENWKEPTWNEYGCDRNVLIDQEGNTVLGAWSGYGECGIEVTRQNAELISAAPKMAEELDRLGALNAQLIESQKFVDSQVSTCGKCGCGKHTPWRDGEYGYVCATCFNEIKNEEIKKAEALNAQLLEAALNGLAVMRSNKELGFYQPQIWINQAEAAIALVEKEAE